MSASSWDSPEPDQLHSGSIASAASAPGCRRVVPDPDLQVASPEKLDALDRLRPAFGDDYPHAEMPAATADILEGYRRVGLPPSGFCRVAEQLELSRSVPPARTGACRPAIEGRGIFRDWTPLRLLRELEKQTGGEFQLRRNGSTDYRIDLVTQIGATGKSVFLQPGRNIRSLKRTRKQGDLITEIRPRGMDVGG